MTTEEAIEYLTRCADGFDPNFDCAVSMAVSALRAQQNCGWISVEDRLPEVDRLAAYEDTGLEPEEISEAANRRHDCKIDCLLKEYNAMMDKIQSLGGLDHLNELSQAEKDGRLVVLPCKITDTVYLIESILKGKKVIGEQVISALIDHVTIGGTAGKPVFDICSATDNWYMALEPGEFFLTREEAEAALAEKGERA